MGNLGTDPSGVTQSEAFAVNVIGAAVGYANTFNAQGASIGQRAVLWRADGIAINLNSLIDPASGWVLNKATAVNDLGWIAGIGTYDPDGAGGQNAYNRMFLIQAPIAEWLLGDFDRNRTVNAQDLSAMLERVDKFAGIRIVGGLVECRFAGNRRSERRWQGDQRRYSRTHQFAQRRRRHGRTGRAGTECNVAGNECSCGDFDLSSTWIAAAPMCDAIAGFLLNSET